MHFALCELSQLSSTILFHIFNKVRKILISQRKQVNIIMKFFSILLKRFNHPYLVCWIGTKRKITGIPFIVASKVHSFVVL